MATLTNDQIRAIWLPLNINRAQPNNQFNRTVERPNNALRMWEVLSCFIDNNYPNAGVNIYNSNGTLDSERTVGLANFDLTFQSDSDSSIISLDASSGRVGIGSTQSENFGRLHVKSNSTGADAAVLSVADTTNAQIARVTNNGMLRLNNYGQGNMDAATLGVAPTTYILGISDNGSLYEFDSSGLGGGGNYANSTLTADANRTHTWGTFDQTESFTTGTQTRTYANGANVLTINETSIGTSFTATDGTTNTGFFSNPALTQIFANNPGTGATNQFIVRPDDIVFQGDVPLLFNSVSGNAGDVLTSQGPGTRPLWVTPSAVTKTVTRKDANYTLTEDIVVVHTNPGVTITLPLVPTVGQTHTIKQRTTGTIVSGNGNNIDGNATYTLPILDQSMNVTFDGVEWVIT